MTFYRWSKTAAANATADATCPFPEGQTPGSVNDGVRAAMAALAKYRDDVAGGITTAGSPTAYTLASNQIFNSLAGLGGKCVAFIAHAANGATATLNVDGLGARPLRIAPGASLPAGTLRAGAPYAAVYNDGAGEFLLFNPFADPYEVPLGALVPFTGTGAPNANFVLPAGQAISRTTYSAYFALVGTTFGAGDGSTTFQVPDLRGRALFGKDDMNGTAANRITGAGSGIAGTTLGAAGGGQTVAIAQGNLPAVALSLSMGAVNLGTVALAGTWAKNSGITVAPSASGVFGVNSGETGGSVAIPPFTPTGTTQTMGSGTAVNKMPPAMVVNYLLRVL